MKRRYYSQSRYISQIVENGNSDQEEGLRNREKTLVILNVSFQKREHIHRQRIAEDAVGNDEEGDRDSGGDSLDCKGGRAQILSDVRSLQQEQTQMYVFFFIGFYILEILKLHEDGLRPRTSHFPLVRPLPRKGFKPKLSIYFKTLTKTSNKTISFYFIRFDNDQFICKVLNFIQLQITLKLANFVSKIRFCIRKETVFTINQHIINIIFYLAHLHQINFLTMHKTWNFRHQSGQATRQSV